MASDDNQTEKRGGDVLGLSGADASIANSASDIPAATTQTDETRRRRRMNDGADELTPGTSDLHRSSGATGIDMGAGGEGTDLD